MKPCALPRGRGRPCPQTTSKVPAFPLIAPNLNAYAERLIQSVQQECLDRFVVMGTRHLDYLVSKNAQHYNTERSHSAIGFSRPGVREGSGIGEEKRGRVVCWTRLGRLLRHERRAG